MTVGNRKAPALYVGTLDGVLAAPVLAEAIAELGRALDQARAEPSGERQWALEVAAETVVDLARSLGALGAE